MGTCCPTSSILSAICRTVFWLERCATLYRYVDARDREFFSPHHFTFPIECQAARQQRHNVSLRDVSVLPEILESGMCHFGVSNPRVVPIVGERNHGSRGRRAKRLQQ